MVDFSNKDFDLDLFIKSFEDSGATVTKGTGRLFVDGKEVNIVDVLKSTFGDVPEPAVELYELSDAGDTVTVKPCRKCFEDRGETAKPEFTWFSDDLNWTNCYRVSCPKCEKGMVADHDPKNVEERWNDWDKPLEEWEEDLDW